MSVSLLSFHRVSCSILSYTFFLSSVSSVTMKPKYVSTVC